MREEVVTKVVKKWLFKYHFSKTKTVISLTQGVCKRDHQKFTTLQGKQKAKSTNAQTNKEVLPPNMIAKRKINIFSLQPQKNIIFLLYLRVG
jgi:hypothetical protein